VQFAVAEGVASFGEGEGPTGPQRMIFGYTRRKDYVDSKGNTWRPGLEYVSPWDMAVDTLLKACFVHRRSMHIGARPIRRYIAMAARKGLLVNLTVGPGEYDVVLHLADTNLGNTVTRR